MYNEHQKLEYIKQIHSGSTSTLEVNIATFKATEKFETEYQKDVCEMTIEEIQKTIDGVSSMRKSSSLNRYYIISSYIDWCLENEIPNANNNIKKVKPNRLSKFKDKTVLNPIQLQSYVEDMYGDSVEEVADILPITALWLSFSGVRREDLNKIKSEHLDFEKQRITYNEENYPIYPQSIDYLKKASTLNYFLVYRNLYEDEAPLIYDRFEGKELLRGIRSLATPTYITTEISRRKKSLGIDLDVNLTTAHLSGICYRFYEKELAGIDPNIRGFALEILYRQHQPEELDSRSKAVKLSKIKRNLENDYESWKIAHNLR